MMGAINEFVHGHSEVNAGIVGNVVDAGFDDISPLYVCIQSAKVYLAIYLIFSAIHYICVIALYLRRDFMTTALIELICAPFTLITYASFDEFGATAIGTINVWTQIISILVICLGLFTWIFFEIRIATEVYKTVHSITRKKKSKRIIHEDESI